MFARKKFIIGGLILLIAASYLGYTGFTNSAIYYYTVSELTERESSANRVNVRVNGQVVNNSIDKEAGGLTLRFIIAEGGETLPVVYQGIVPDAFKDGADIVIEGQLNSAGVFQADNILAKCPSKYVPEE